MNLFDLNMQKNLENKAPLADRCRPINLEEFVGQTHILGPGKFLTRLIKSDRITSMLFYGPPGVGKTTLAKIIANITNKNFVELSAVTSNIKELREVLKTAEDDFKFSNIETIVFIDEIHRFNKTQQDALLPYVEKGIIILIGATTENPYFEVNKALISRMKILNFVALNNEDLNKLIDRALTDKVRGFGKLNIELSKEARDFLIRNASGDGRFILNSLEIAILSTEKTGDSLKLTLKDMENSMQKKNLIYDNGANEHYDTISAFIKSIRGSDANAALYYLAKMLEAGEDIKFIARRLIISASEDVGNANPLGMVVASACFQNINAVGMPEARIILAQCTTYLASSPKSNASYVGINEAIEDVRKGEHGTIPTYLRDPNNPANKTNEKYLYPHDYKNSYVNQKYLPLEFQNKEYYRPKNIGYEKNILEYLKKIKE